MPNHKVSSRSEANRDPESVIEKQLETYNARDLEGYMALFHDDVEVYDHPGILTMRGAQSVRERYTKIFHDYRDNYCRLLHRIVLGEKVIDHECVYRNGVKNEGIEMLAVYEVRQGLIIRMDFIRKGD